jgi:hypothetical protein
MRKVTIKPKDPNSTLLIPSEGIRATFKPWKKTPKLEFTEEERKAFAEIFKGDPVEIQRKMRDEW